MDYLSKILIDFELHAVEGINNCFENGIDPNMEYKGRPLLIELINQYTRGPQFKECVRAFVKHGLEWEDQILLAVLLDDAPMLEAQLKIQPESIHRRYSFNCAFTPLFEVSLLHLCAEYNHLSCAQILLSYGTDVNVKAGTDEFGFGGQTPIFHTVNQNGNKCIAMMKYLLAESADLELTVKGLIWGKGYSWETFIPAVNPISYAMMGLLPQFQRREELIYEVVSILLATAYGIQYQPPNVPNAYLES